MQLSAPFPAVIQGGMGAGVSDWKLANAVSSAGHLGVVSGTALDVIMARRLQVGDIGGHIRRALDAFPIPGVAKRIIDRYFVDGGKAANVPFKSKPMPSEAPSKAGIELLVAANFVEVFLAKEGHQNPVGINLLEKIQSPTLPSLYGAMLAGVSVVLMGAGIPRAIPGAMDQLAQHQTTELALDVAGATSEDHFVTRFEPAALWPEQTPPAPIARPDFFAIVASATLAIMLTKKANGRVDGFVVEGPTAGGHNAPPRGPLQLNAEGEPIYGDRDVVNLDTIKSLGLPFWLAGSFGSPGRLIEAQSLGAAGVQVGTAFAYCEESGLASEIKQEVLRLSARGEIKAFTDPVASPTGFPLKILQLAGTRADPAVAPKVPRMCDLGYLRHAYKQADGTMAWRCPAEPVADYVKRGGNEADTAGRMCVCNGLMTTIGLGQVRTDTGKVELALVTSGDDVATVARFLKPGHTSYSAADVLETLLSPVVAER